MKALIFVKLLFTLLLGIVSKSEIKYFLDETDLNKLIAQEPKIKIRVGVLAIPLTPKWRKQTLAKDISAFNFFTKNACSTIQDCPEITDPNLKSDAWNALKANSEDIKHIPTKYITWILGAHNFFDLSSKPDPENMKAYVDLFEIVPLSLSSSHKKLRAEINKLDGILFTGGPNEFYEPNNRNLATKPGPDRIPTQLLEMGKVILNEVELINTNDKFLPVWGSCQGFELIALSLAQTDFTYDIYDDNKGHVHAVYPAAEDLNYSKTISKHSNNSLKSMMSETMDSNTSNRSYLYYHNWGFNPLSFATEPNLKKKLDIIYLSNQTDQNPSDMSAVDKLVKEFVSIFEHKTFPIYGVQFHPEYFFNANLKKLKDNEEQYRRDNLNFSRFFVSKIMQSKLKSCKSSFYNISPKMKKTPSKSTEKNFKELDWAFLEMEDYFTKKIVHDFTNYETNNPELADTFNNNIITIIDNGVDLDRRNASVISNVTNFALTTDIGPYEKIILFKK